MVRSQWSLTQAEMASRMGVSLRAYQNYETHEREPRAVDLAPLGEYGINLNWLLTGEGQMRREEGGESHDSASLDEGLLEVCIEAVEEEVGRAKRTISASNKAKAVSALYDLLMDEENEDRHPDVKIVRQFIKLAG